jgi:hypothetical protein
MPKSTKRAGGQVIANDYSRETLNFRGYKVLELLWYLARVSTTKRQNKVRQFSTATGVKVTAFHARENVARRLGTRLAQMKLRAQGVAWTTCIP